MFALCCARHDAAISNYRRVWVPGGTYFFTANLLDRRQRLLVEHVGALRDAFRQTHAQRPFEILVIVILPDHLNYLWRLPAGDADNDTRWRSIKTRFSRALPTGERRSALRCMKGELGIWQRRCLEHLVRDDRDLLAHVDYIHINPVKHGHAARAVDWPYSSFHRAVLHGELPVDWATAPADAPKAAGERIRPQGGS